MLEEHWNQSVMPALSNSQWRYSKKIDREDRYCEREKGELKGLEGELATLKAQR